MHRAVWAWRARPSDPDPLLEAFVRVGQLVDCCVYDDGSSAAYKAISLTLGDAIWTTSCQMPRSPSPPPYSLVDLTSRADNFALTYIAMPILLPEDAFEFERCGICALGTKQKRISGVGGVEGSGRWRKRFRKRCAVEHAAYDNGMSPRITELE